MPCKYDSIGAIVDRLTKSAHFLPVKAIHTAEQYDELYIKEIVRLHGTPISIISDRGAQFSANFWKKLQQGFGNQVNTSTTFHPRTDEQAERTIQTLEDTMAPFEALYGRRCRSLIRWFETGETELIGPDLVHQTMEKVKIITKWLKTTQSRQKSYSDVHLKDLEFKEDDWRIGRVAYKLELPPEKPLVHPVFHVSMLKKVVGDPSLIVPVEAIKVNEELTYEETPVAILDRPQDKDGNFSIIIFWPETFLIMEADAANYRGSESERKYLIDLYKKFKGEIQREEHKDRFKCSLSFLVF
ncbi:uncharacterized protein [Nicotiana tomentosiformis]|uniref:uncharacterized protein n=1 Tax=Nicotiana tomentosiformis TaxID=4098 RepID=UPI00388CCBC9